MAFVPYENYDHELVAYSVAAGATIVGLLVGGGAAAIVACHTGSTACVPTILASAMGVGGTWGGVTRYYSNQSSLLEPPEQQTMDASDATPLLGRIRTDPNPNRLEGLCTGAGNGMAVGLGVGTAVGLALAAPVGWSVLPLALCVSPTLLGALGAGLRASQWPSCCGPLSSTPMFDSGSQTGSSVSASDSASVSDLDSDSGEELPYGNGY